MTVLNTLGWVLIAVNVMVAALLIREGRVLGTRFPVQVSALALLFTLRATSRVVLLVWGRSWLISAIDSVTLVALLVVLLNVRSIVRGVALAREHAEETQIDYDIALNEYTDTVWQQLDTPLAELDAALAALRVVTDPDEREQLCHSATQSLAQIHARASQAER